MFVLLVAGLLAPSAPASTAQVPDADNQVVTAGFRYFPGDDAVPVPTLTILEGDSLEYAANFDFGIGSRHSVTDVQCEDGDENTPCRFDSDLKGFLEGGPVTGVPDLDPGSYSFTCILHPSLRGTLVVQGA